MNTTEVLILNIIGGVIAAFIFLMIIRSIKYFRKRRFKYLLGYDADIEGEINLVYAKLSLPTLYDEEHNEVKYPYIKPKYRGEPPPVGFSIEFPVSSCEVRALKYLTSSLFNQFSGKTKLVSDIDDGIEKKLDLSFISIGGPLSNYKTEDILGNDSNTLVKMSSNSFYSIDNARLITEFEAGYDYGLILRLRPAEFSRRVWIVCAGIGEWGTSGSAWFLSNKYEEILKKVKSRFNLFTFGKGKDFAAIVKVKREQDESAKLMALFTKKEDIAKYLEKLEKEKFPKVNHQNGFTPENQIRSASAADTYDTTAGTNSQITKDDK